MKLNLLMDSPGDVRSGYVNVDPHAPQGDEHGRVRGDVFDLSHVADAGEVSEIVALDLLDSAPVAEAEAVLNHWLSRLAHGGRLTVSVVDLREVARSFLNGVLSTDEANALLFGAQDRPWRFKRAAYTLPQLVDAMASLGYRVLAKRVQDFRAVVTVERP